MLSSSSYCISNRPLVLLSLSTVRVSNRRSVSLSPLNRHFRVHNSTFSSTNFVYRSSVSSLIFLSVTTLEFLKFNYSSQNPKFLKYHLHLQVYRSSVSSLIFCTKFKVQIPHSFFSM